MRCCVMYVPLAADSLSYVYKQLEVRSHVIHMVACGCPCARDVREHRHGHHYFEGKRFELILPSHIIKPQTEFLTTPDCKYCRIRLVVCWRLDLSLLTLVSLSYKTHSLSPSHPIRFSENPVYCNTFRMQTGWWLRTTCSQQTPKQPKTLWTRP
jgi:hypothetical protein